MRKFPRIIFFGTPEFAVPSLDLLVDAGYPVVAVVTAPDKPSGRGLKRLQSPVWECAVRLGIPVLQPVNMRDSGFAEQLKLFKPDLQIVIAFRMLPRMVWSLPPLGTFNLHASLLPQYRGAAPINRVIMNGEKETGLTTFLLNEQIDEGKILFSEKTAIASNETAGELHDRLMQMGPGLVLKTVEHLLSGKITGTAQDLCIDDTAVLNRAPKIFKDDCRINWDQDVLSIHNFIRGLSPYPGAFTELIMADGTHQMLKIFKANPQNGIVNSPPGCFFTEGKSIIKVSAKNGYLQIEQLQLAGRKALNSGDFIRGFRWIFSETHGNSHF